MKNKIDMALVSENYRVDPDGRIWSFRNGRYMKSYISNAGYSVVHLSYGMKYHIGVHRLVAARYLGECPDGMEVNHKDGNKQNNHWTNLEYVSHGENIKKSYDENGRVSHWLGVKRGLMTEGHKKKLAERKHKPVVADTGEVWPSVMACADALGITRITVYNAIRGGRRLKCGLLLKFVG